MCSFGRPARASRSSSTRRPCRGCSSIAAIIRSSSPARRTRASRAWLSECLQSANWLVKALDQRARTIVKVVSEIVKRQQGFFERGVSAMKPMTLREVAEAIGMHELTVSRVTSNKYLLCDRGLYELKYFFGSGVHRPRARAPPPRR